MRSFSNPRTVKDRIDYLFSVTTPPFLKKPCLNLCYEFTILIDRRAVLSFERVHAFYQHDWVPTSILHLVGDPEQSNDTEAHVTARMIEDTDATRIQRSLLELPMYPNTEECEETVRFLDKHPTLPGFERGIRVPYDGETLARRIIRALPEELR